MTTKSSPTRRSLDQRLRRLHQTHCSLDEVQRRLRHSRGFSLIELMVVVLIVSILAGIAVPSYLSSIRVSRRTDAKTALLDLAAREERYFATNNGSYTNSLSALGYSSSTVGNGYYYIQTPITVGAGSTSAVATFSITALPVATGPQSKDLLCTSFTITNTGLQTAGGNDVNANVNCWNGSNQ
jgi:type IV pilus assembly protein PilE